MLTQGFFLYSAGLYIGMSKVDLCGIIKHPAWSYALCSACYTEMYLTLKTEKQTNTQRNKLPWVRDVCGVFSGLSPSSRVETPAPAPAVPAACRVGRSGRFSTDSLTISSTKLVCVSITQLKNSK